jgi:hypothetical protein
LLVTLQLIRKHKLREEYALIWFAASLAIFLLSIFDRIVALLATLFAVKYAPTLILVFGILFCVVLLLEQTVMLSMQANRIRDLAQTLGIMEWRLRELENQASDGAQSSGFTGNGSQLTSDAQIEQINS